jgi:hypothetical protein
MWIIIIAAVAIFGVVGGYATDKSNKMVSNISFAIGYGAVTVLMIKSMITKYDEGIMFYIFAMIALRAVILTITHFISFMKKL